MCCHFSFQLKVSKLMVGYIMIYKISLNRNNSFLSDLYIYNVICSRHFIGHPLYIYQKTQSKRPLNTLPQTSSAARAPMYLLPGAINAGHTNVSQRCVHAHLQVKYFMISYQHLSFHSKQICYQIFIQPSRVGSLTANTSSC